MMGPTGLSGLLGLLRKAWEAAPARSVVGRGGEEWGQLELVISMNASVVRLAGGTLKQAHSSIASAARDVMSTDFVRWLRRATLLECDYDNGRTVGSLLRLCHRGPKERFGVVIATWEQPADTQSLAKDLENISGHGWSIAGLLWHAGGWTWGLVAVSGYTIQHPAPAIREEARATLAKKVANLSPEAARNAVDALVKRQACGSILCEGPGGHACCLAKANRLPARLVALVDLLQIDTDMLADPLHCCTRRSIKQWFSYSPGDRDFGSMGDALRPGAVRQLAGHRILAYPHASENFIRRVLGVVGKAMTQDASTLCLLWSPVALKPDDIPPDCSAYKLGVARHVTAEASDSFAVGRDGTHAQLGYHELWVLGGLSDGGESDVPALPEGASWTQVAAILAPWKPMQITQRFAANTAQVARFMKQMDEAREDARAQMALARINAKATLYMTQARGPPRTDDDEAGSTTRTTTKATLQRELMSMIRAESVCLVRAGRGLRSLVRVLQQAHLDTADRPSEERLPDRWDPNRPCDPEDETVEWIADMKSRKGVCAYVGEGWPEPALMARHAGASWVVRVQQDDMCNHERPTVVSDIGGDRCMHLVDWKLTWSALREAPSGVYLDVGAIDELLLVRQSVGAETTRFSVVPWHRFHTQHPPLDNGPHNQKTFRRGRSEKLLTILRSRWIPWATRSGAKRKPEEQPEGEAQRHPVPQTEDRSLPDATPPASTSEVLHPGWILDLDSREARAAYGEAVEGAIEEGLDSRAALKAAAEQVGALRRATPGTDDVAPRSRTKRRGRKEPGDIDPAEAALRDIQDYLEVWDPQAGIPDRVLDPARPMFPSLVGKLAAHPDSVVEARALVDQELYEMHNARLLGEQAERAVRRWKAEEKARRLYRENPGAALRKMTRGDAAGSKSTIHELVQEVRDRGAELKAFTALNGWTPRKFVYPPDPAHQHSMTDILIDFNFDVPGQLSVEAVAPREQQPKQRLADYYRLWQPQEQTFDAWLALRPIPVPVSDSDALRVTLPQRDFDFAKVAETILEMVMSGAGDFAPNANGAVTVDVTTPETLDALSFGDLLVDGIHPDAVLVTDGSGTNLPQATRGPGGFGVLIVTRESVHVIIGGGLKTTSGAMEMAAALEACAILGDDARPGPLSGVTEALCVSDYDTWVKARVGKLGYLHFKGKCNLQTWVGILTALKSWGASDPDGRKAMHRMHVRSHASGLLSWGQMLNEIADRLAAAAKQLVLDKKLPAWAPQAHTQSRNLDDVKAAVAGPYSADELEAAISKRTTKVIDSEGNTVQMLKAAGPGLVDKLLEEGNAAAHAGRYPTPAESEHIVGMHSAIGKKDGGNRHLTAPDTVQAVFSTADANRLLTALLEKQSMRKAQKCNIPRLAGCVENITLLMASLYDFHRAAKNGQLPIGTRRVFLFSDISKAFDRVQLEPLVQAIRTVLRDIKGDALDRIIAKLVHLYDATKIAVTVKGLTVFVAKLAGVHQGDPMSAIVFAILMEYVRILAPPDSRPYMRFYTSVALDLLRAEMDYADDQIRATDSVQAMARLVRQLQKDLAHVGLTWNPSKVLVLGLEVKQDGSVGTFDPELDDGVGGTLTHIGEDDWFVALGVVTNWKGDSFQAGKLAAATEEALIYRTRNSVFPIPAKLYAHSVATAHKSEYLYYNLWISNDIMEEMDKRERKSIRAFFGHTNLPNAVIRSELRLSCRGWRSEIMMLTGLVRSLGSKDQRVQAAARLMSRDAAPKTMREGELLEPRFFDWRGVIPVSLKCCLLNTPMHYAEIAKRWLVGLKEEHERLVVTFKGHALENPYNILKVLAKEAERRSLADLEERVSTACRNGRAPHMSCNWGLSGMKDRHRKEMLRFIGPHSTFSSKEMILLYRLRLRILPTAMRDSVRSSRATSARCYCGAVQTITHLLLVPAGNTKHSHDLRMVSSRRHAAAMMEAIAPFVMRLADSVVACETIAEVSPDVQGIRDAINRAREARALSLVSGASDAPQHFKPDSLIAHRAAGSNTYSVKVIDLCFASDDKLMIEDTILQWRRREYKASTTNRKPTDRQRRNEARGPRLMSEAKWLCSDAFDKDGKFTAQGIRGLPVHLQQDAETLTCFHPARYGKRYHPLQEAIRKDGLVPTLDRRPPELVVIAVGVSGWLPEYTREGIKGLCEFTDSKQADPQQVIDRLILTAQVWACKAWKAFKEESPPPLPL